MKPRILIFSTAYFPLVGGAEVAVKELTDRLADFDFELATVDLTGNLPVTERLGRVLVRRVGRGWRGKYFFPLMAARQAGVWHRQRPYDLVWAIMANQAGMAAALFKRRFPSVPVVLTLQEGDDLNSLTYRARLWGPRLFRVFSLTDKITAISNYLAGWAKQQGARGTVAVIPNGVSAEYFNLPPKTYKLTTKPLIITTSRLVKKNGVDILIEALKFLPTNVRLQIVGVGPEEESLKSKVKSQKLGMRVDFIGTLPPAAIAGALGQADLFARPSRSEGLGNSFLEAMAAGLPVVGTPVGGIPDFLTDGKTGWFCRGNDPADLAQKIRFVLDPINQALVNRVIQQAADLVREKYDWDKITGQYATVFSGLLQRAHVN